MKQHFKNRLLKLADFLMTVPKEKFDMNNWFNEGKELEPTPEELLLGKPVDCGTTACALGWACMVPEFKKAGLKLEPVYGDLTPTCRLQLGERTTNAEDTGDVFFGLNSDEFDALFMPFSYKAKEHKDITPKQVAVKIRKFVATK